MKMRQLYWGTAAAERGLGGCAQPEAALRKVLYLQRADEDGESLVSALLEHLLACRVEVLGDVVGGGLLLIDNFGDDAGANLPAIGR
jgi:hypothetical protein